MRDFFAISVIVLILTLGAGLAWFTQNPESPWLEEAQSWPWVGPLATSFRQAYLGPAAIEPAPATENEEEPVVIVQGSRGRKGGSSPAETPSDSFTEPIHIGPSAEEMIATAKRVEAISRRIQRRSKPTAPTEPAIPTVQLKPLEYMDRDWFLPGQIIASSAGSGAVIRHRLTRMAYLPVLERQGVWVKILFRGEEGWIDTSWEPPYSRRKARRGLARHRYEPVQASDSQQLKKARQILGVEDANRELGPYQLLTDVEDEKLLDFLDLTARKAEDAYFARFGRLPSGDPTRSIILFAREAEYQEFYENEGALRTAGHAFRGTLAMWAERRTQLSLAKTLVHEIAHLTNSRALAYSLPNWLQEGMAVELASIVVEEDATAGRVAGSDDEHHHPALLSVDMGILQLAGHLERGDLPSVTQLIQIDRDLFMKPELVAYAYAHSGAFIRFLLDGHDRQYREGFIKFLGKIAAGYEPTPVLLLKNLDQDGETLDQHFRSWLRKAASEAQRELETTLLG